MMFRFASSLVLAIASATVAATMAQAAPIWDANGNYKFVNSYAYRAWEIVEGDSSGTNCRMAEQFRPAVFESQNMNSTDVPDGHYDIGQWSVLVSIETGTRLTAPLTGRAGERQTVVKDVYGKPWIAVNTYLGACFVRGNQAYIQPVESSRYDYRAFVTGR